MTDSALSFEAVADACDNARSPEAAGRVFLEAARRHGFAAAMLVTHTQSDQLGRFSVCVHNFREPVAFIASPVELQTRNPLFDAASASDAPVFWQRVRADPRLPLAQRQWLERLQAHGLETGVTQSLSGAWAPASVSLTPAQPGDQNIARMMRVALYVFHHIVALQQPKLSQADLLTQREYECLSLAILEGLRPREVARALGVSVNTVRTLRQSAMGRLNARNQEEAVWRMLETGQLFQPGRPPAGASGGHRNDEKRSAKK